MMNASEYNYILRNDFMSFIERSFYELNPQTTLLPADYIEAMVTKLEACHQGKIKRLIINLPPRYLKSHCASIAFVAWVLGHDPGKHIICASYGQDLADKMARDCRTLMNSSFYKTVFSTRLSRDRQAIHDFMTTELGTRMATSVGGVLTGRGADYIILDDPLKPDDAMSEVGRKNVNDWFDNTLLSRLNDKTNGCIIIIMQRLHQDDLVGHVLEQGHWEVLSFPAIAEGDEIHVIESPFGKRYFKRREGDVLHPERDSAATLATIRQQVGEYTFASQYQQNPAPLGGALVKTKWLRPYKTGELPAQFDRIVQSWDTANKAGELNDYSVCTTWGEKDGHLYLLNVFRRRLEFPDLKRAVREQARLYAPTNILIEDKASGTQLIQELISEGMSKIVRYEYPTVTDKATRLYSQTATIENGFVHLPEEAPWLEDFIKEVTSFPGSKYDDQVDSMTQFLEWTKRPIPYAGLMKYMEMQIEEQRRENAAPKSLWDIAQEQQRRIQERQMHRGRW